VRREANPPRPDWERRVEEVGLRHHTAGGVPYWNEEAHYVFSMAEVRRIEDATRELHALCLEAAEAVIEGKRYAELAIPPLAVPLIEASWEADAPSLYGRFDLSYDGRGEPKMLEYNADTPTSLVEAAVAQWYWLEDRFPGADQFNRIHEALVETWAELRPYLSPAASTSPPCRTRRTRPRWSTFATRRSRRGWRRCSSGGGDRVGPAGAGVRGRGGAAHPLRLQAVPVGVDGARGVRAEPGRVRAPCSGWSRRGR
jgi:hypothetical protein